MLTTIIAVELIMLNTFKRLKYRNDIQMKNTKYVYNVLKHHIILHSVKYSQLNILYKQTHPSARKLYSIQWHVI